MATTSSPLIMRRMSGASGTAAASAWTVCACGERQEQQPGEEGQHRQQPALQG
jgi:hypothetical protein